MDLKWKKDFKLLVQILKEVATDKLNAGFEHLPRYTEDNHEQTPLVWPLAGLRIELGASRSVK
jgi:hypothetical protein